MELFAFCLLLPICTVVSGSDVAPTNEVSSQMKFLIGCAGLTLALTGLGNSFDVTPKIICFQLCIQCEVSIIVLADFHICFYMISWFRIFPYVNMLLLICRFPYLTAFLFLLTLQFVDSEKPS